ncbi:MAG: YybH family protein [Gemmatimonadaceae bacterium]
MRHLIPFAFLLVPLGCAAHTRATPPAASCGDDSTPVECTADERAIRAALTRYAEIFNSGRRVEALLFIADSTQIGWTSRGDSIPFRINLPRAIERARTSDVNPAGPRRSLGVQVEEIIHSGDLALVRDVWTTTLAWPESTRIQRSRSFELFRRQFDGKWKIVRWVDIPFL